MASLPTKLECATTKLVLGQPLRCRVLVYNPASQVDEVTPVAAGPLAAWVAFQPERLPLLPETEGAFDVVVEVPGDARLVAGERPLVVEIRSGLAGTEPSVSERSLDVGRITGASLSVRPAPQPHGSYEIVVDSRSNHPLRLEVAARAPVDVVVEPRALDLDPFATGTAVLRVGGSVVEPFAVEVAATGDHLELRSQLTHVPPPARVCEPGRCLDPRLLTGAVVAAAALLATTDTSPWLMVLLTVWLLFGFAGCRITTAKCRSWWAGWALGLVLPAFGLIVAAVLSPKGGAQRRR